MGAVEPIARAGGLGRRSAAIRTGRSCTSASATRTPSSPSTTSRVVDLLSLGQQVPGTSTSRSSSRAPTARHPHARPRARCRHHRGVRHRRVRQRVWRPWRGVSSRPARTEITVHMDGGRARVRLDHPQPGRVTLIGPSVYVGTITIDIDSTTGGRMTNSVQRSTRRNAHRAHQAGAHRARRGHAAAVTPTTTPRPASTSSRCWSTPRAPTRSAGWCSAATRPTTPGSSARARSKSCASCASRSTPTPWCSTTTSAPRSSSTSRSCSAVPRSTAPPSILDIFGQNAHTLEGKAQVELALLRYRLPRLRRGIKANLSQQSGGIGTRTRGKGETKLETDRRTLMRRITRLEHDLQDLARHPPPAAQEPRPQRPGCGHHRRLHQRRQEHAAQPADPGRRAGRGPAVRHARSDHSPAVAARWRAGAAHRHRRLRPPPAARSDRGVQGHARGRQRGRLPGARRRRSAADPVGQIAAVRARARPRSTPTRCPSCSCSTRPTSPPMWPRS